MMERRYLPAGESALVVEFGATADPAFHEAVLALDAALAATPIDAIFETVPTYRSLMVHYDPRRAGFAEMVRILDAVAVSQVTSRLARTWRIPACYEPPHGEDLVELADVIGRPVEDIVELHVCGLYTVVMYGFAPGFVFLSGLPDPLMVSRRTTPRPPAPPGALTIANGQALIASIAMPTGWYVLGRTPARTFDPGRDPVFPIEVGDAVRFERVDAKTFIRLEREAAAGRELLLAEPTE